MTIASSNQKTHQISADHPSLPGHFPGNPIVPGVVILNEVFADVRMAFPDWELAGIRKLKFLQPLAPEQNFTLQYGQIKDDTLRFKCLLAKNETSLAEGRLKLRRKEA